MAAVQKTQGNAPLPAKLAGLLREAKWLALTALAAYLLLVLATFNKGDPGWSHSATGAVTQNAGGRVGAWLADLLLYLFGLSAYWWAALCGALVAWGYPKIDALPAAQGKARGAQRSGYHLQDRRSLWIALCGFALLLVASASLEALRLHTLKAELPLAPGGMIGLMVSGFLATVAGFTGATLLLLTLAAVGLSLLTGVSWLAAAEATGLLLESAWNLGRGALERRRDEKIGEQAREVRETVVQAEKKREEDHPPLVIAQPPPEIKRSERVQKEKQAPLFEHLPDTPLPPLKLLDEPGKETETVSAETVEFTSRLIEKKLSDFGVAVKVLAAYPGPVITRYEIEPSVGVKGSQIVNLIKDLARALSVVSIRVVETIPSKSCMGLEIPNPRRQTVRLSQILSSRVYAEMSSPITLAMGKDIAGKPIVADLAKMPHVLVAGTTGSGK